MQISYASVLGACACSSGRRAPGQAQQPTKSVDPTASSVKEQQLLQEFKAIQGRVSIPDQRSGVLDSPRAVNGGVSAT